MGVDVAAETSVVGNEAAVDVAATVEARADIVVAVEDSVVIGVVEKAGTADAGEEEEATVVAAMALNSVSLPLNAGRLSRSRALRFFLGCLPAEAHSFLFQRCIVFFQLRMLSQKRNPSTHSEWSK